MNDFLDFFNALSNQDFEEEPVLIEEFVSSKEYLGLPPLSDYQYQIVRAMSQIYKYETLLALYGEKAAHQRYKETCHEVVLQLGKGAGKDYTSTIAVAYVVYLLLCLRDPAEYYGRPSGDAIDIINIAINSDQANRVFFKNFLVRIKKCPWFDGKYDEKQTEVTFDKNVNVYSGHSQREAFEGYNTFMVILDEISGFALENTTGHHQAKTGPDIYMMYRGSITSRYSDYGKLVSLSWPRFERDFIQTLYDGPDDPDAEIKGVVAEKETVIRQHTFKRDPDLPDGMEGNEFTIEWEEDHIIRYRHKGIFALRRPSWEVNPTKNIENYKRDFDDNLGDALGRFACMPSNLEDGFFKNKEKIDSSFCKMNGVDHDGVFHPSFQPKPEVRYYVHVDLAQKHDHCAVAIGHVAKWVHVSVGANYKEVLPLIVIDAVRWWTPRKEKSVDFKDVVDYIKALRRRGFDIRLATFDRWNSHDTMKDLERNGIKTDILSVDKKHYDDFLSVMYDDRLVGPDEDLLKTELGQLRQVMRGQKVVIDHPRQGSKDLSDAVCGAIFNAVAHTPREYNQELDIVTLNDLKKEEREARQKELEESGVIHAPPNTKVPPALEDYLDNIFIA